MQRLGAAVGFERGVVDVSGNSVWRNYRRYYESFLGKFLTSSKI
jgi:hypothetical protein